MICLLLTTNFSYISLLSMTLKRVLNSQLLTYLVINIWSQYFIAVIKKCVKTLQNLDTYASTTVAIKIFSNLYWTTFSK